MRLVRRPPLHHIPMRCTTRLRSICKKGRARDPKAHSLMIYCWRAFAQIQTDLRPDGRVELCLLIKLAGEATASRRRAVNRASEKRGKLARFVDLLERGDKHDSDLDHCSAWTKARLILRLRPPTWHELSISWTPQPHPISDTDAHAAARSLVSTGPGDALWRNPITGITACCARAASGQAAAAPPSSVMKSRPFIGG